MILRVSGLAVVLLASCATSNPDRPGLPQGAVALRTRELDGHVLTLGQLRNRVVLVTVITTWADTALIEVPFLKELYDHRSRDELEIVCIALDEQEEPVRVFRETFEIPYPVVRVEDPAWFVSAEGPFGPISIVPTSFLVGPGGEIAARMEGTWSPRVLVEAIDRLVASDPRTH